MTYWFVKSTGCSWRGPRLGSQHPCGCSLLCATTVLGDLLPSSGLFGLQAHMRYNTYIWAKHHADDMKRIF